MQAWVIFVALFGLFKGIREPIKKRALQKDNLLGVLFLYAFLGFLMVIPTAKNVFDIPPAVFALIFVKSFSVFSAWRLAFLSVKRMPVSLYGVIDMSRVVFSTLLGVFFLGEALTLRGTVSLLIVLLGIYLVNRKKSGSQETISQKYIWFTIISCILNAISGTLDKCIMSKNVITSSQLQFWFMLMMSLMYLAMILIKREKVNLFSCLKNPYIYALSVLLVLGDRLLFIANADPNSHVTVMTLIKQCSVIVTIISGKIFYKEKNIVYKLICALIIIFGIILAVI